MLQDENLKIIKKLFLNTICTDNLFSLLACLHNLFDLSHSFLKQGYPDKRFYGKPKDKTMENYVTSFTLRCHCETNCQILGKPID